MKEENLHNKLLEKTNEEIIHYIIFTYGEEIKRLIITYVKSYDVADDIFQEFLIKTYNSLSGFRSDSSLKTWLYRIAINKCKDYLRSPIHRLIHYTDKLSSIKKEESAEDAYLEKENNEQLARTVLSLSIKYREVMILKYYKDLSIQEVSAALGINESTVKTRIMRGKNKLQNKIGGADIGISK
ncbi:sigma-70 family RNA polymerase sigma factor [Virgibacillus sp. DJP39]|uniref:sigma-70 family RNA polymerase sigma factor n=1 Tax=Virgibacillus sp. DJP39 TaxID=3409790 RepID=UPI003BB4F43C